MESKNIQDFQAAWNDLRRPKNWFPTALLSSLRGFTCRWSPMALVKDQQANIRNGSTTGRFANHCENRPEYLSGRERAASFYYLVGDTAKASRLEAELIEKGVCEWSPKWALMFEQHQLVELETDLRSHLPDLDAKICLGLVLAEKSEAGRSEARQIFDELLQDDIPLHTMLLPLISPFSWVIQRGAAQPPRRFLRRDVGLNGDGGTM